MYAPEQDSHNATPPQNLPAQLTSFVAREAEVAAVRQLLQRDTVRLVTLTGPGGIGKTRLALAVAGQCLADFRDGLFFVSLDTITDASLVLPTVAQTLGLREKANTGLRENLYAHLHDKELLLVLDNYEQVIASASEVNQLLAAAPHLRIVVTSRESLQVRGEQEYPVPVLELPDFKKLPPLDELGQYAAIKLFVQRGQTVRPDFALHDSNAATIAEICHRLDGLPLAIELAAASIKVLPAQIILSRLAERFDLPKSNLRDRPDRQRTLRASISWSYDLLTEQEKAIFRRVSIFAGSFTLECAEAIGQRTGVDRHIVLDTLAALAAKSLIRPIEFQSSSQLSGQNPRFAMLQTIREIGLNLLAETGELEAVRDAHAAYYAQMAQEAGREIWGAAVAEWVSRLDAENENLRAALHDYLAHPQGAEAALRMVGSLWRFWEIRGYVHEGRAWIERALSRRAEVAPAGRWLALHAAGNLALDQGDYAIATRYYRESLQLLLALQPTLQDAHQLLRTRYAIGNTLTNLGRTALFQSQIKEALAFTEQSLNIHRQIISEQSSTQGTQIGTQIGIAIPTTNRAMIKLYQSQYAQAETYSNEALAIYRQLGDERGIGWNLHILGTVARDRGDYKRAAQLYAETMAHFERLSNQADLPPLYLDMGELARLQGNAHQAETEFRRGLELAQALGNKKETAKSLTCLSVMARQRGDYAEASALGERGLTLHREIGDQFGLSDALHNRGWLALAERRVRAAAADFVESLRMKARLGERKGIVALLIALGELASMEPSTTSRAARLLAAAESLQLEIGLNVPPVERAEAEARLAAIRAQLGEGTFAAAREEGQLMEMQQAVAYALREETQAEG